MAPMIRQLHTATQRRHRYPICGARIVINSRSQTFSRNMSGKPSPLADFLDASNTLLNESDHLKSNLSRPSITVYPSRRAHWSEWNSQGNSSCPILIVRLNETFARSPVPSLFLTLPLEILEMILNLVLHHLLLQMISRQRPRLIISQYRDLILTCKRFKVVIDHGSPKVHTHYTAQRYRAGESVIYCPNIRLINDNNIHDLEKEPLFSEQYFTQWSVIFKVYQKISIRNAHLNYGNPLEYLHTVGKFWLNDRVSLGDFRNIYRERHYQSGLLLILSNAILNRAHPIEESCGDVATLPGLEWYLYRHTTHAHRTV